MCSLISAGEAYTINDDFILTQYKSSLMSNGGLVQMEFVQKKRSTKHVFTLYDHYFNFAYEDRSGSSDGDIHYADFPQKSSIQIEQNEWLRNVGYLWMALGALQFGYAIYSDASLSGKGVWIVLGIACIVWSNYSKIKYTVFRSGRSNIFVIQDKQHDQIIEEINARRKSQLLQWFGDVNPENDLDNEIQKFQWLAEQGVLSQEESENKIAQVEFMKIEHSGVQREWLN